MIKTFWERLLIWDKDSLFWWFSARTYQYYPSSHGYWSSYYDNDKKTKPKDLKYYYLRFMFDLMNNLANLFKMSEDYYSPKWVKFLRKTRMFKR